MDKGKQQGLGCLGRRGPESESYRRPQSPETQTPRQPEPQDAEHIRPLRVLG